MNRYLFVAVFAFVSALLVAAPAQESQDSSPTAAGQAEPSQVNDQPDWLVAESESSITVRDAAGNLVEIAKPVQSVVANGMGELFATIRALDAEELVLASTEYVTRNSGFFPEMSRLPSISTVDQVNQELVVELNPDVIFSTREFFPMLSATVTETFPVVQLDFETIKDIEMVGAIVEREVEADAYVSWIESYTDMIDDRIATLDSEEYQELFIFYGGEWGLAPAPPYGTFGRQNPRNGLVRRAGGVSITEELDGDWITVDAEWVVEQDPPLIVRETYVVNERPEMGYNVVGTQGSRRLMEAIVSQAAIQSTSAVEDGRVLMVYGDLFEDSWFLATAYLAKYFHPDLFPDLDPVEMHREFLTRFQGLDFDIDEQGVFTYSLD